MFILYALPLGTLAGWALGGQLGGVGTLAFRWAPLALIGLLTQVVLFFGPVSERIGSAGVPIYVASTLVVLAALLRNIAIPGLAITAAGAISNTAAIVANGGSMPAAPGALALLGKRVAAGYSNSVPDYHPVLAPLTDQFALPAAVPWANVFSIGDVLIALGIGVTIAVAMRGAGALRHLPPPSRATSTEGS